MTLNKTGSSLFKLTDETEISLYLIGEELKSRKFFNGLLELGLDNCYYQPNLDKLIMAFVGMHDDADETFDFYYHVIEKHSKLITARKESVTHQALEAYIELAAEVRRRTVLT